ncbi:winged helix-turn-helix transcriptional regulator [Haloterrigena sp. H1]|uniref:winged helix-turn-helix transcriptional regulator n=1 Tax=Haloterrigena sp. H1 TaxID=2552943 RepID=UPI001485F4FB|nr:helix-turn-helix domain-containing protein [Haloterrigena sp. H1]
MTGVSSISSHAFAIILVAVVLSGAMAGVAAGKSAAGVGTVGSTNALESVLNETTDELESTTEPTTDDLEITTNETTAAVENTTKTLDDTVSSTTELTTDDLETTTNETTQTVEKTAETLDDTLNATAETVDGTVNETPEVIDGGNATANASLGVGSDSTRAAQTPSADPDGPDTGEQGPNETAGRGDDASGPADPPSTGEAAANAVLVGLLGAIASGTAASNAAGAGTSGVAGSAGTAAAGWLSTLREAVHLRRPGTDNLRRAGTDLWKALPIFRYSRYDDSDPLEHDRRRAIYETIRDRPGTYLSAVSDRTEIPLSTVRYHVRILEDEGLLTTRTVNGKRRYFLEDDDAELQAALEDPAKRAVLEAIADCGRVHNSQLADELDRDPSTVSHHLAALEDDGLVVRERDGRSIVNGLPPRVAAALADDPTPAADASAAPADD